MKISSAYTFPFAYYEVQDVIPLDGTTNTRVLMVGRTGLTYEKVGNLAQLGGGADAMLMNFDTATQRVVAYSWGGSGTEQVNAIARTTQNYIVVGTTTSKTSYPTYNVPASWGYTTCPSTATSSGFIVVFASAGQDSPGTLVTSGCLGGGNTEILDVAAWGSSFWLVGGTSDISLVPAAAGKWPEYAQNGASKDALIAKYDFEVAAEPALKFATRYGGSGAILTEIVMAGSNPYGGADLIEFFATGKTTNSGLLVKKPFCTQSGIPTGGLGFYIAGNAVNGGAPEYASYFCNNFTSAQTSISATYLDAVSIDVYASFTASGALPLYRTTGVFGNFPPVSPSNSLGTVITKIRHRFWGNNTAASLSKAAWLADMPDARVLFDWTLKHMHIVAKHVPNMDSAGTPEVNAPIGSKTTADSMDTKYLLTDKDFKSIIATARFGGDSNATNQDYPTAISWSSYSFAGKAYDPVKWNRKWERTRGILIGGKTARAAYTGVPTTMTSGYGAFLANVDPYNEPWAKESLQQATAPEQAFEDSQHNNDNIVYVYVVSPGNGTQGGINFDNPISMRDRTAALGNFISIGNNRNDISGIPTFLTSVVSSVSKNIIFVDAGSTARSLVSSTGIRTSLKNTLLDVKAHIQARILASSTTSRSIVLITDAFRCNKTVSTCTESFFDEVNAVALEIQDLNGTAVIAPAGDFKEGLEASNRVYNYAFVKYGTPKTRQPAILVGGWYPRRFASDPSTFWEESNFGSDVALYADVFAKGASNVKFGRASPVFFGVGFADEYFKGTATSAAITAGVAATYMRNYRANLFHHQDISNALRAHGASVQIPRATPNGPPPAHPHGQAILVKYSTPLYCGQLTPPSP